MEKLSIAQLQSVITALHWVVSLSLSSLVIGAFARTNKPKPPGEAKLPYGSTVQIGTIVVLGVLAYAMHCFLTSSFAAGMLTMWLILKFIRATEV